MNNQMIKHMEKSKHCEICENQLYDFKTGTRCGITNERPCFKEKCSDIIFDKKYQDKIREVNIEFESIRRDKFLYYLNFSLYFGIGVSLMFTGYFLGVYLFKKGAMSTVPMVIIGIGFLVLPKAIGSLVSYYQKISVAQMKKTKLDEILSRYNIEYSIDVIINADIHDNKEIEANLTFLRKHYR